MAIARTLAYNPEVLLFDEPFGALDAQTRVHCDGRYGAAKKVNVPAVFITHDQEEALKLGDRIAVINAGRIEQIGTPVEVYNNPATEYVATFLGAANILEGTVRSGDLEIGSARLPLGPKAKNLNDGQAVKLIFRPEDVLLSMTQELPGGQACISSGVVEELSFVGAYERVRIRLDPSGGSSCEPGDEATPHKETPEATAKPIIATRRSPTLCRPRLKLSTAYRGSHDVYHPPVHAGKAKTALSFRFQERRRREIIAPRVSPGYLQDRISEPRRATLGLHGFRVSVARFAGSDLCARLIPGLTPGAIFFRAFGAESFD